MGSALLAEAHRQALLRHILSTAWRMSRGWRVGTPASQCALICLATDGQSPRKFSLPTEAPVNFWH